jgi:arylsulfatase A-like enzyme
LRLGTFLVGALAVLGSVSPALAQRPNFVVVVFDDLGYADLGVYGSPLIQTPHMDRLAAEGTRFTRFYANAPSCSPSRAALLTGRYPVSMGIRHNVVPQSLRGLPLEVPTLAETLKQAGYATGHFGKWHLGDARPEDLPSARGFDRSAVGLKPGFRNEELLVDGVTSVAVDGHLTEITTDYAIEFLEAHRDEPFFLSLWYHTPHTIYDPPQRWADQYPATKEGQYAAMVSDGDEQLGRLLARIEELGLAANTLVLVTSDNGPSDKALPSPLTGHKWDVYEGGIRVPLVAWWPGHVAAGAVEDGVTAGFDLAPTLAELAEVGNAAPAYHGRSLAGVLTGSEPAPRRAIVWESSMGSRSPAPGPPEDWNRWAVMDGDWKLVRQDADRPPELYDVAADPSESDDLAALHPEVVERLGLAYASWRRRSALLTSRAERIEGEAANHAPWYRFDGGGVVLEPSSALRIDDGDFTFQARVWPRRVDGTQTIAEQPGSWSLRLSGGRLQLELRDRSGAQLALGGAGLLTDHAPVEVAFTLFGVRGSPNPLRLYLNGLLEAETAIDGLALSDEPVRLGLDAAGQAPFEGTLWSPSLRRNALLPQELADRDGDGVPDAADRCIGVADPPALAGGDQADRDGDGFGDACDADFDGDGLVGALDWLRVSVAYGSSLGEPAYDPVVDLDGDGRIGGAEIQRVNQAYGRPPGPSGIACAGTLLCLGP